MIIHHSKKLDIKQSTNTVLQNNRRKFIIKQTQQYLSSLADNLLGSYEPFNNTVTPDDCVDRLVAGRISSKFHVEDPRRSDQLQSECYSNYLEYDKGLSLTTEIKPFSHLSQARALLHTWFKEFRVDVASGRYEVTPGETFLSSAGEVSIRSKLFHKNHWTTTANCLDDTCVFIYNNHAFKRASKQHIGVVTRRERRLLYLRFRNSRDVGFDIFKHLLISRVLILTDGARASSVPKSNDKRRFINVEAMFPVILQRIVAHELKSVLAKVGNDLSNEKLVTDVFGMKNLERSAQALHGAMIKDNRFSTIDFSNASDSVTLAAVCSLFPKQVSDILIRYRSHYVAIDDELVSPRKLSSMGNGFTFEVMTTMLYAIASTYTSDCRVYGDDVILPSEFAHQFVSTCSEIDFRVNTTKTFISSFFRESCGYFYSDHIRDYITSFDFNQVESISDVIISCNKLTVLLEANQVTPDLYAELLETRDRIDALIHASRKGPIPVTDNLQRKYLSLFVFHTGYEKKQRRCKELRTLRQHYIEKNAHHFRGCQIASANASLIYIPFFVPAKSKHVFTDARELDILLPALYGTTRLKPVIRGKGRWIDLPAFVYSDGTISLISNLIQPHSVWKNRLEGVIQSRY